MTKGYGGEKDVTLRQKSRLVRTDAGVRKSLHMIVVFKSNQVQIMD